MENRRQERGREDPCYLFPDFPKTATDKIRETRGKRLSQNTLQEPQQKKYCQSPRAGEKSEDGKREARKKKRCTEIACSCDTFYLFLTQKQSQKGYLPSCNCTTQKHAERERERHQITSSERHTIHRYCPSPSRTPQKPGQRDTVATVWSVRYSRKAGIPDTPPIHHTHRNTHRNTHRDTQREKEKSAKDTSRTQKCAET